MTVNEIKFSVKISLLNHHGEIPAPVTVKLEVMHPKSYQLNKEAIIQNLLSYPTLNPIFHLVHVDEEQTDNRHIYTFELEPLASGKLPLMFKKVTLTSVDKTEPAVHLVPEVLFYTAEIPASHAQLTSFISPLLPLNSPFSSQVAGPLRREMSSFPSSLLKSQAASINKHAFPFLGLIGCLLVLLIYLKLKYQPKKTFKNERPIFSRMLRQQQALQLLDVLYKTPQADHYQKYFTCLADMVKEKLETPQQPISALTSEEFLQKVQSQQNLKYSSEQLKSFLNLCSAVKFANYRPTMEECQKALEAAKTFIQ